MNNFDVHSVTVCSSAPLGYKKCRNCGTPTPIKCRKCKTCEANFLFKSEFPCTVKNEVFHTVSTSTECDVQKVAGPSVCVKVTGKVLNQRATKSQIVVILVLAKCPCIHDNSSMIVDATLHCVLDKKELHLPFSIDFR